MFPAHFVSFWPISQPRTGRPPKLGCLHNLLHTMYGRAALSSCARRIHLWCRGTSCPKQAHLTVSLPVYSMERTLKATRPASPTDRPPGTGGLPFSLGISPVVGRLTLDQEAEVRPLHPQPFLPAFTFQAHMLLMEMNEDVDHQNYPVYSSKEEFYSERGGSDRSEEVDFGVRNWDDLAPELGPWSQQCPCRVSYITETGDWYALQMWGGHQRILLLGSVPQGLPPGYVDHYFIGWEVGLAGWGKDLSWFFNKILLVRQVES